MDEHIIDYVLRRLYDEREIVKRKPYRSKRDRLDELMMYCKFCNTVWEKVEKYIDKKRWLKYENKLIPTIGKKREVCPECINIKVQKK